MVMDKVRGLFRRKADEPEDVIEETTDTDENIIDEHEQFDEDTAKREIDEADDNETKRRYQRRLWMSRLKLDKHHKMERFIAMTGGLAVLIVGSATVGLYQSRAARTATQNATNVYTDVVQMSLSDTRLTVGNLMSSPNRHTTYIPLFIDDFSALSANATDYEIFYTDFESSPEDLPEVDLHIFASANMLVVEVSDDKPLESEALDFSIRNNYELSGVTPMTEQEAAEAYRDPSYGLHDQGHLVVNPGSVGIETTNALNQELSPDRLYYVLHGIDQEAAMKETIDDSLENMYYHKRLAETNLSRITELGFNAPTLPSDVADDKLTPTDDADVIEDEESLNEVQSEDFDIELREGERESTFDDLLNFDFDYNYEASTVSSGGAKFDFYVNMLDGYIEQVVDDPSNLPIYLRRLEEDMTNNSSDYEPYEVESVIRNDGVVFDKTDLQNGTATEQNIYDLLTAVESSVSSYRSERQTLQTQSMPNLLRLEADVVTQPNGYQRISEEATDMVTPY